MQKSVWDFNSGSPDPVRQAAVREWQSWLDGVQSQRERVRLARELRSREDQENFSARLELYFHHYFQSQGCRVDFHPRLEASFERPDLLIHHPSGKFYLEATIRREERSLIDKQEFADLLEEELSSICSPHWLYVHIHEACPEKGVIPEIRQFLEERLQEFEERAQQERKFVWRKSVGSKEYLYHFSLIRKPKASGRLRVSSIIGGWAKTDKILFDTIDIKAQKYGSLKTPFVIAVWGLGYPEIDDELNALYGTGTLIFERDSVGNFIKGSERQERQPDGVFTSIEDGKPGNSKVSAVVFYQHRLGMKHPHVLRIYHNPYAESPLSLEVFQGFAQFAPILLDPGFR